jgi:hypothetical protein
MQQIADALRERHGASLRPGETLDIGARTGKRAAELACMVGTERRAHEVVLFVRNVDGEGIDGALGVLVDYLDAILEELAGSDDHYLPLDDEGRPYEKHVVFVRGIVRDYVAEEAAAKLLDEPAPPRALEIVNAHHA